MIIKGKERRRARVGAKLFGMKERPRFSVFRSNRYIYAQLIDDDGGRTLAFSSGADAEVVGKEIANQAKKKKIERVIFDRGSYKFHGKVKAVAEAARRAGLKF